jgi:hypothetical protein
MIKLFFLKGDDMKFKVGDKVIHHGHGTGIIVKMNATQKNLYFEEKPLDAIKAISGNSLLIKGLANSLYDESRYPYVVKFEDGYQDVYSEIDLKEVTNGKEKLFRKSVRATSSQESGRSY